MLELRGEMFREPRDYVEVKWLKWYLVRAERLQLLQRNSQRHNSGSNPTFPETAVLSL